MEDLSEEAKIISEALEFHAEESRRIQFDSGKANSSADSLPETGASTKARQIQLPPVQKGNLDFMPISKEKEAILSRDQTILVTAKRSQRRGTAFEGVPANDGCIIRCGAKEKGEVALSGVRE